MAKHTRNQHYVPRLYLRRFAAEQRKNPLIYLFDKTTGESRRTSVGSVGAELFFYEREDNGIERWFADVEHAFVGPYQRLLQTDTLAGFAEADVSAIVLFMAAQLVRTREQRAHLKSLGIAIRELLSQQSPDYDPAWSDVSDETLRVQHVSMLPDLIHHCSEIMLQMKPILLINRSTMPLWTSDHPITVHNELDAGPRGNLGLMCRGIEVHFPLSPTRSLCLCDPVTFDGLPDIMNSSDTQHPTFLNSLQVIMSTRFLFGNASDFSMAREIISRHPRLADPTRPRFQTN